MKNHMHSELIDKLGGTVVVAGLCAVTSQAVSKWRRVGIPDARMMFIRAIRPDLFVDAFSPCVTNKKTEKQEAISP